MQTQQSFDPSFYYGYVADNLLKNLGPKALEYADKALIKMKTIGDAEGFDIWLSIHEQLTCRATPEQQAVKSPLH